VRRIYVGAYQSLKCEINLYVAPYFVSAFDIDRMVVFRWIYNQMIKLKCWLPHTLEQKVASVCRGTMVWMEAGKQKLLTLDFGHLLGIKVVKVSA